MKTKKYVAILLLAVLTMVVLLPAIGLAAEPSSAGSAAGSGGYLAGYENTEPRPTSVSWWSTLAYFVSLLAVFGFVLFLAYYASKFLSGRFAQAATDNGGRILEHLPLGPNRSVCVVELAGRIFVLGVTEHSITLLREVTDPDEIERLHRNMLGRVSAGSSPLAEQMASVERLARRIPSIFRKDSSYH